MCSTRHRWATPFWVGLLLTIAPACHATAGGQGKFGQERLGDRIVKRFAYRPAYPGPNPIPRTRPLYLSGYAGARYDMRPVPQAGLTPTQAIGQEIPVPYWTPTARGLGGLFGLEPGTFRP